MPENLPLGRPGDAEALIKVLSQDPPDLIVVDTLARAMTGLDENSQKDMGQLICNVDQLREELGCAVVLVHHSGHSDKGRERGSSSLRGAADMTHQVTRVGDLVTLSTKKAKDSSGDLMLRFRAKVVEVRKDDDGESVTSCQLVPDTSTSEAVRKQSRKEVLADKVADILADVDPDVGMATAELAKLVGVSRRTMSRYLTGDNVDSSVVNVGSKGQHRWCLQPNGGRRDEDMGTSLRTGCGQVP